MPTLLAKYSQLGKSGLRVSVLIVGTMGYGNPMWAAADPSAQWVLDEEHSLPIPKATWDRGLKCSLFLMNGHTSLNKLKAPLIPPTSTRTAIQRAFSQSSLNGIKGSVPNPLGSLETPRWKSLSSYGISKEEQVDAEMITRVEEIAKRRGWAMLQVALAWVLRSVSSPIVGFNSLKRIEQGIVDGELTDEEAAYWRGPISQSTFAAMLVRF